MPNKTPPKGKTAEAAVLAVLALLLCALCAVGGYALTTWRTVQVPPPTLVPVIALAPPTQAGAPQVSPTQPAAAAEILAPSAAAPPLPSATSRPVTADIEQLMSRMSLEQKVGQMIMTVLPGETIKGEGKKLIVENYIGGIIYYHENVNDPAQAASLSRDLQNLAAGNDPAIPVLIAMDYEGGRKDRFESGATTFPYNMALGAARSPELVYQAAAAAARQLRSAGIMLSFGPVVDINVEPGNPVIGLRSYSSDLNLVLEMQRAAIAGLQENGVIAVAKHFPGHGDTKVDSHGEIPYINKTLEELLASDLIPFARAAGQQVGGMMVGHIANLEIDPGGFPATLSPALVNGILRGELGYQGVVFTDGMMMGAVINKYPAEEAAQRAVKAGCDILLINNPNWAVDARNWIIQAVHNGLIEQEEIDASVRRILTMKAQYGLLSFPLPDPPPVSLEEDQKLAEEIARRAVTARQPMSFPALSPGKLVLISPEMLPTGAVEGDNLSLLGELLTQRGFSVEEWIYPVKDPQRTDELLAQAAGSLDSGRSVMLVTWNAALRLSYSADGSQERIIQAVASSGAPALYVASGLPYDLSLYPAQAPALATFGILDIQLQALVDALLADRPPPGIMPVQLPE